MLRAFSIKQGTLSELKLGGEDMIAGISSASWIDLHEPTDDERNLLEGYVKTELPEGDDVEEIEASARYFIGSNGIHIHSLFLSQAEGRHSTTTVAFILQEDRLITVREGDTADFRLLRMRARRGQVEAHSSQDLLVSVFDQKVENLADGLEDIHRKLEEVSFLVLEEETSDMEDAIDQLAKLEDSNGKILLCLMDTQRSVSFLLRHLRNHPEIHDSAREIMRDIETLMSHTSYLFNKINFLMDAAQGFINIQQNQIIKIFSIAAVVFLPPTLVASIYGMNFEHMPELEWILGYPWALGLMILSGLAPYLFFKRKGWL